MYDYDLYYRPIYLPASRSVRSFINFTPTIITRYYHVPDESFYPIKGRTNLHYAPETAYRRLTRVSEPISHTNSYDDYSMSWVPRKYRNLLLDYASNDYRTIEDTMSDLRLQAKSLKDKIDYSTLLPEDHFIGYNEISRRSYPRYSPWREINSVHALKDIYNDYITPDSHISHNRQFKLDAGIPSKKNLYTDLHLSDITPLHHTKIFKRNRLKDESDQVKTDILNLSQYISKKTDVHKMPDSTVHYPWSYIYNIPINPKSTDKFSQERYDDESISKKLGREYHKKRRHPQTHQFFPLTTRSASPSIETRHYTEPIFTPRSKPSSKEAEKELPQRDKIVPADDIEISAENSSAMKSDKTISDEIINNSTIFFPGETEALNIEKSEDIRKEVVEEKSKNDSLLHANLIFDENLLPEKRVQKNSENNAPLEKEKKKDEEKNIVVKMKKKKKLSTEMPTKNFEKEKDLLKIDAVAKTLTNQESFDLKIDTASEKVQEQDNEMEIPKEDDTKNKSDAVANVQTDSIEKLNEAGDHIEITVEEQELEYAKRRRSILQDEEDPWKGLEASLSSQYPTQPISEEIVRDESIQEVTEITTVEEKSDEASAHEPLHDISDQQELLQESDSQAEHIEDEDIMAERLKKRRSTVFEEDENFWEP